jgi:hypothetical protein
MRTERTIRKCSVRMKFVCPRTWQALLPTAEPDVRHCAHCKQDVYFCRTDEETLRHARAGHCIAREEPRSDELPALVLGTPEESPDITPRQEQALAWHTREDGIASALNNGPLEGDRDCPGCGYPVPGFRKTCYVCAFELGRG